MGGDVAGALLAVDHPGAPSVLEAPESGTFDHLEGSHSGRVRRS